MAAPREVGRDSIARMSAEDRREVLLDAASAMVMDGGPTAVTMGTVAERCEVARGLVYKHFANREEILRALYHREAARIDRLIRREIAAAPDGFEPKFRAYVAGVVEHVAEMSPMLVQLQGVSADAGFSTTQHDWDRRTVAYFADLAVDRFGIDRARARLATPMLLGGIAPLLAQLRSTSGRAKRAALQQLYCDLAIGALAAIAD